MSDQTPVVQSASEDTPTDRSGDSGGRIARHRAANASQSQSRATRALEIPPLVAILPEVNREAMEGLYAIRLATEWLESRVDADPESRMAIALIRQSEVQLRRMLERTRAEALCVLDRAQ